MGDDSIQLRASRSTLEGVTATGHVVKLQSRQQTIIDYASATLFQGANDGQKDFAILLEVELDWRGLSQELCIIHVVDVASVQRFPLYPLSLRICIAAQAENHCMHLQFRMRGYAFEVKHAFTKHLPAHVVQRPKRAES